MTFTVAIVGRPTVGKSTLFNRLVGKRLAIVDDTPGVTRDRREGQARLGDLKFRLIDTAGLEEAAAASLASRMRGQTDRAVEGADIVLFVVDARSGITPLDRHFAQWVRRAKRPVLLVANKCEGRIAASDLADAFALGLGEPIPISAEHGEGLGDLHDAIGAHAPRPAASPEEGAPEEVDLAAPMQLAIVGRPNVGKSTLINRLIGDDRVLTGPEPGITRDAIAVEWNFKGRPIRLFDTAGLRRRARVVQRIERLSTEDTLRAIRFAEVVVLVLDASDMLEKQDLAIAKQVVDEGRALVIAANKWDAVADKKEALVKLEARLAASLPQTRGIAAVPVSARTGLNLDRLMKAVLKTHEVWNRRVSTPEINRWLAASMESHSPPVVQGRRLKIRYMTQIKSRPPTFALFMARPQALPDSYLRYLVNSLRDRFDLPGVPIRMVMRAGKNPYAKAER